MLTIYQNASSRAFQSCKFQGGAPETGPVFSSTSNRSANSYAKPAFIYSTIWATIGNKCFLNYGMRLHWTLAGQNKFALSLWHPVVVWAVPQQGGHVPVMLAVFLWHLPLGNNLPALVTHLSLQPFHSMQLTCILPIRDLHLKHMCLEDKLRGKKNPKDRTGRKACLQSISTKWYNDHHMWNTTHVCIHKSRWCKFKVL